MAQTTQPAYQNGQLVTAVSVLAVQDGARNLVGSSIAAILGLNSANSMDAPFSVSASGGMNVLAGGSGGQKLLLNTSAGPRLVDAIPSQSFTVPNASTVNPRIDLLCGRYAQTQVGSGNGEIATLSGTTITTALDPIFNATESLTYQYVTGTASSSPVAPAAPSGYVPLATIAVSANATSIINSNITLLLTPAQTQILSGVAGFVDLTSNQSVNGNKTFNGVSTVGGIQFASTDAAFSGVAGIRVNSPGSILISPRGPGHSINLGYDDTGLSGIYFGPVDTWGHINATGYTSPDGTGTFGTSVSVRNGFVHAGSSSLTGIANVGDGIFERNGTSGAIFLGNSGSSYLYFDSNNFNFGRGSNLLAANVTTAGFYISSSGFQVPNLGGQTVLGLTFGNNTAGGASTGLGSRGAAVGGILPTILNIENIGTAQLVALDQFGNLGIAGGLASTGLSVAGTASVSSSATIGTTLTVSGVQIPTGFTSTDGTVSLVNSGGTLVGSVPSGLTYGDSLRPNPGSYPYTSPTVSTGTLPGSPAKQYRLIARMSCDLNFSGVQTLTGSGASWEGPVSQQDGGGGSQPIELRGTAVGGQNPGVTWTNNNGLGSTNYIGVLEIQARAI